MLGTWTLRLMQPQCPEANPHPPALTTPATQTSGKNERPFERERWDSTYGSQGHILTRHGVLQKDDIRAPIKVNVQDPRPFGLPKVLTIAHVSSKVLLFTMAPCSLPLYKISSALLRAIHTQSRQLVCCIVH